VCHKTDLVFKLLDDGKKEEKNFTIESNINQHFCQWSHYALHSTPITQSQPPTYQKPVNSSGFQSDKIQKNEKEENKEKNANSNEKSKKVWQVWNLYNNITIGTTDFRPKWLNITGKETLKIMKDNFRYSNRISENNSYLDVSNITKHLCIYMFVSVDIDCYLNVILTLGNETVTKRVTGFNKENSLKEWKRIEVKIENYLTDNFTENGKLMFSRGHSNGSKEGYWAIDNIAFCRPSVEINNMKLSLNISYNSVCKVLDTNLTDTTICEKKGYIGKYCNITCSQVLGKSHSNCENYMICSENSNCYCPWGYEGEFCNKTCDSGRWGINCSSNCSANCEACDNIKNCTKCKKEFLQDYPDFLCNETLPVLTRPPVLTSITEHSLTVFVNMTYDQTARKPEYYQIQYKNV
jgi:hypothetical protein